MLGLKIFLYIMVVLMLLGIIEASTKCSKRIAGMIAVVCIALLAAIVAKENQPEVTAVAPETGKIQTEQDTWGNNYGNRRYRRNARVSRLYTYFRHLPV